MFDGNYLLGVFRVYYMEGVVLMFPTCLTLTEKIGVTIVCTNEKKYDHVYIETDSLLGATRIINTYDPKRGYRVVNVKIEEVPALM
jgi:hypothetical protein